MLTNDISSASLLNKKEELIEVIPEEYEDFIEYDGEITHISFPVLQYPTKVKSLKLGQAPYN